jgi:hypothetical protein
MSGMDASESLVRDFLLQRGYADIVYEPDGKVPPDFLIDGRIAVEVRRLNQSYETGSRMRGLEEDSIPPVAKNRETGAIFWCADAGTKLVRFL